MSGDRELATGLPAFAIMTATLVVGFFVLSRMGPPEGPDSLSAATLHGDRDRDNAARDDLARLRGEGSQTIGAIKVDPHTAPPSMWIHVEPPLPGRNENIRPSDREPPDSRWRVETQVHPDSDTGLQQPTPDTTQPPPSQTGSRGRYIVKPGDTLIGIAEKQLGDRRKAGTILRANPKLEGQGGLVSGMELTLPTR